MINIHLFVSVYIIFFTKNLKVKKLNTFALVFFFIHNIYYNNVKSFINNSYFYQLVNYLNSPNNIIIIFTLIVIITNLKKNNNKYIIVNLMFFYFIINLNKTNMFYIGWLKHTILNLNINLLNGIVLIHPIALYLSYTLCLFFIIDVIIFYICIHKKQINDYYNNLNFLIFVSLFLGGWWAEQELSWGGWWSWDFVELLALGFYLNNLIYTHKKINKITKHRFVIFFIYFILLSFICVRYNLINSIHNFLDINTNNQHLHYLYFILFICLIQNTKHVYKSFIKNTIILKNFFFFKLIINIIILSFYIMFISVNNYPIKTPYTCIIIFVSILIIITYIKYISVYILSLCLLKFNILSILILYLLMFFNQKILINIHYVVVFYFVSILDEIYIFYKDNINTQIYSIVYYKLNTNSLIKSTTNIFKINIDFFFLEKLSKISYENFFKNIKVSTYHIIYERKIFNKNNYIYEIFNFNQQKFLNLVLLTIVFIVTVSLFYICVYTQIWKFIKLI